MKKSGFTLIEILLVGSLTLIIITLGGVNLIRPQRKTIETSVIDNIVSDLNAQQTKSMVGDISTGGAPTKYGIYFESDKYTLFKGDTYSSLNATNLVIVLPSSQTFSVINVPSGQILFSKRSGDFDNYSAGQNTLTVTNQDSGDQKLVQINRYGIVTAVQ